jgi:signal transduction histidine kinase
LVDQEVQGGLLGKAACYWLLSLAVVTALNVLGWIYITPGADALIRMRAQVPSLLGALLVAVVSSLILLPVLMYDLAKHTNRFAGPIYRLQRCMNDLAAGKPVRPIAFRKDDYWKALAESFNQVISRIDTLEQPCTSTEFVEFDTVTARD